MNGAKLCFSGMIALGIAVAMASGACSSSSTAPPPPTDSGVVAETGPIDDAGADSGAGARCNPLLGQLCSQGQTCCLSGLIGTCLAQGSCSAPFQVSCTTKSDCSSGVCCGSVQFPAGFDAAAGFDGSEFDAGFDAAGFGLALQCTSACPFPDFELCTTAQDCPAGYRCSGGPAGGGFAGILACIPLDAGGGPVEADAEAGPSGASGVSEADSGDGG
jgi:hypothetical protein